MTLEKHAERIKEALLKPTYTISAYDDLTVVMLVVIDKLNEVVEILKEVKDGGRGSEPKPRPKRKPGRKPARKLA